MRSSTDALDGVENGATPISIPLFPHSLFRNLSHVPLIISVITVSYSSASIDGINIMSHVVSSMINLNLTKTWLLLAGTEMRKGRVTLGYPSPYYHTIIIEGM